MISHLQNKTVIITGASSGIGSELAKLFAKSGANVCLIARRKDALITVKQICDQYDMNRNHSIFECDVTNLAALKNVIETIQNIYSSIDICIANAGISLSTIAGDNLIKDFETVIKTNLIAPMALFDAVLPIMKKQGTGQIVGIGSLASYRGLPGSAAYCASKSGLMSMMESMRHDLNKQNITTTIINPGYIKTPLTARNL